jgi:hypothetical protein
MQEVAMQERLWDAPSATPWYREQAPSWRQAWYDDDTSLTAKYARVLSEDLAGIGIWALGYDGTRPELWAVLGNAFGAPTSSVDAVARLVAAPNPFRDRVVFRFTGNGSAAPVAIHDVRGRIVRLLPAGARAWDGRDFTGRDVAAGVYFAQLRRDGAAPPTHRLVRIR